MIKTILRASIYFLFIFTLSATATKNNMAVTRSIPIEDIQGYDNYSKTVKHLIELAQKLALKNLTYQYGSANPDNGGMDCSGTMYYLLKQAGISHIPRDANGMYNWVKKQDKLHTITKQDMSSGEFKDLKPGNLLFWTGTYNIANQAHISHVMLYLGIDKQNKHLMFGASNGRSYQGNKMWGVSVFDFKMRLDANAKFVGYSCIPELTCR